MWTPEQKQVTKEKVSAKVLSVAWSTDGTMLAVGLQNGVISIRSNQGEEIQRIERKAAVWSLAFLPHIPGPAGSSSTAKGNGSPAETATESDLLVVGCWDKSLSTYRYVIHDD